MTETGNQRLTGKVAIITGSGKGIGEAVARRFATEGARVVVNARSEDDVQRVVTAIKASLGPMRLQGGGRMLFVSSIQGNRAAVPGTAHYSTSKAGLNGFIRSAALEFARDLITVNGVEPGMTLTPGVEQSISAERREKMAQTVPLKRFGTPEEVAGAMLFLASDDAAYVTGQTLVMDGGATLPVFRG